MELIKINDSKLKVMLSEGDLKCYNLDCDKLDYDCSATKEAFREILNEAKKETGFDTGDEKIFVQIYPGRCGGCEMYVTKLGFDEIETELHALSAVYCFDDFPSLAKACSILQQYGFKDRSSLYSLKEKYFLAISEDFKQNNNTYSVNERGKGVPHYPILSEYGKRIRADQSLAFIKEHGVAICAENAVACMSILK